MGRELWKTDGTERGTELVRDISPGPASSPKEGYSRYPATVVGSRVLFPASDGEHGIELWASDGTGDGTRMLADFQRGPSSSVFTFGPVIDSVLYFRAETREAGYELGRTDGTSAGTRMITDLNPGPASSLFHGTVLSEFGPLVLFYAWDGVRYGFFATDGTAEGTRFIVSGDAYFGGQLGDRFLFTSRSGESGPWTLLQLHQSGDTQVLRDGFRERPYLFTVAGGIAYFVANDGTTGAEVWRSDGTATGTSLFTDLTQGANGSGIFGMTALGERLLIEGQGNFWSSDGTATGTRLLSSPQATSSGSVVGDRYYFFSVTATGWELMKTDGTPEGTTFVAGGSSGVHIKDPTFIPRADGVFFGAREPITGAGLEPWISDGTPSGTQLLKTIAPRFTLSSSPYSLANAGGRLFFRASQTGSEGTRSHATWISDGTSAGTSMLPDSSGEWWFNSDAVASGGFYYFVKRTAIGSKLYRTDGTLAGTVPLASEDGDVRLVPFRNGILWAGVNSEAVELWFSDGTGGGTRMLARIAPKQAGVALDAQPISVAGDHAFFGLDGFTVGIPEPVLLESQVWRTDGTVEGTRLFNDDDIGPWRYPRAFTRVGPWIYFVVASSYDLDLWRVHVSSGESALVRSLGRVNSINLAALGDTLLLMIDGQLWRSDGTTEGTTLLRERVKSTFRGATVGNGLFFWIGSTDNQWQVWRSDGTAEGTFLLQEISGQWRTAPVPPLHFSDGALFFPGSDPIHGIEPWASDGTLEGTRMLADLNPGTRSSLPSEFLRIGKILYVSAEERSVGRELWSVAIYCTGKCAPRRHSVRH